MKITQDTVISNEKIAKDTYQMVLQPEEMPVILAGQFVNIKIDGLLLRRPISICSINETTYMIIYKVVGEGTKKLSEMAVGTTLDVLKPLGSFFPIHEELDEVLLIGGGVGIPPLYEVAKQYRKRNKRVAVVLGFNDMESKFYDIEFRQLGCSIYVATMDGTSGIKGTVMDCIRQYDLKIEYIYSCGPLRMLEAINQNYSKGYLSFEARMACGMGACMGCVCKDSKDKELYYRICKEGPVFEVGKVDMGC